MRETMDRNPDAYYGSTPDTDSPVEDEGSSPRLFELTELMNAAIAEIGPGPYQLIVLFFGGGVYLAEGSFLLMLSIVARSLIVKWSLSPLLAGAMAGVIFVGLFFGNFFGGLMCDRYGRRPPILLTYLGVALCTFIAIWVPGFLLLLAAKLFLGFCLGFGLPAANAIVAESCPPAHRSNIYCMTMVLFSLGQLYSAVIVWAINPSLSHDLEHWRGMLLAAACLPLLLLGLAFVFLEESPHWLMLNWRVAEARDVVTTMMQYKDLDTGCNKPSDFNAFLRRAASRSMHTTSCWRRAAPHNTEGMLPSPGTDEDDPPSCSQGMQNSLRDIRNGLGRDFNRLQSLFSRSYRLTTGIMVYTAMAANFAYYGMIYGLPGTLKRETAKEEQQGAQDGWSPGAGLMVSAVSEIPGAFLAVILAATIGRRTNMSFAFCGCTLCLFATVWAMETDRITDNLGLLFVFGVKVFLASGYIIVYLYLLECYPTDFRATGLAFCMVTGRLGAAACPFLYDGLSFVRSDDDNFFFMIMAWLLGTASLACCFLPYETKDTVLEEVAPPGTCTPTLEEHVPLLKLKEMAPTPVNNWPQRSVTP